MNENEQKLLRDVWEKLNLYRDEAMKGPLGSSYIGGPRYIDLERDVKAALSQ